MSQGRSVTILASTPYSKNILVSLLILIMKNVLTQQIRNVRPHILVTLLKMRPHYS